MARKKADETTLIRIYDWSGGENNAINPALLNSNESAVLENYVLDDKGTLFPRKGAAPRYATPFDNVPVAGMEAFYRSDGVSKLLIGTESGKLYVDTPHLVNSYDSKVEWETGKLFGCLAHSDGKVRTMRMKDGFESGTFDNWHVRDSGWSIVTSPIKTGAKAAQATSANQKLTYELGQNAAQTYVSLYVYFGETNKDHYPVKLISPGGTEIWAVVAASDGHFKYHNGTALSNFPTDKTYAAATWYKVEVFQQGGTFWVHIDGQCLTPSGLALKDTANNAQTQVAKVTIQNAGADAASMTVDDVEISSLAPVFSRSSVAYKQDGTQVAANVPRFEAGKFAQAQMVEEGTTNLWVYSDPTDLAQLDVYGNVSIAAAGSVDTRFAGGVVFGDNSVARYAYKRPSLAASTTYTVSAYIKMDDGSQPVPGTDFKFVLAGVLFIPNKVELVSGTLYRVWGSYTTPSSIPTYNTGIVKYTDSSAKSFKVSGFQFEQKGYATSYMPTSGAAVTRSAEALTIPTAGVLNFQEGTIELWFKPSQAFWNGSWNRLIGHATATNYNDIELMRSGITSKLAFAISNNSGSPANGSWTAVESTTQIVPDTWYYIAVIWSVSQGRYALFINGVKEDEAPLTSDAVPSVVGILALGYHPNILGRWANSLIDDLRISSRARTDAEIAAAYSSNAPLPVDEDTTYKLAFDGDLNYGYQPAWLSPVIDASQATDKASGHAGLTATIPGSAIVAIQSRSAPSQTGPWSNWYNALPDGSLQHPADSFVQVRLLAQIGGEDEPMLDKLTVSFDGTPTVTLLASDFTAGGQFYFAVLQDKIGIVNGLDAPRKYDGNTLSLVGGNPPHASQIAVHKNRWWLAKGSRLYFSDPLDIDNWPVLNFIDINPNDGDFITGLKSYGDYLVITKQHSMWLLTGEGINTFAVRRIHAGKGAYSGRSLVIVNDMISFAMADGIYFSDLTQALLMSERERQRWDALNARRFDVIASWYARNKLYISAPDGNAIRNTVVIVYDTLRQAFIGAFNWKASCWCEWREAGKLVTLFGSSENGQVYEIESGYTDGTQAYTARYMSKVFNFGMPEVYKLWNKVYLEVLSVDQDATLNLYFYIDGIKYGPLAVLVPASATQKVYSILALASAVGVIGGRRLAIEIEQNVLNNPVGVQLISIEAIAKGERPTYYRPV